MIYPKIYKDQPYRLQLQTGIPLSSVDAMRLAYKDPDGTIGTFGATMVEVSSIYADITAAQNSKAGDWNFQAEIKLSAGVTFYTPGQNVTVKVFSRFT